MSNIQLDRPFALALEIADLRQRLAAAEAEWHQIVAARPVKPARVSPRSGKGPSISQRVLSLITDSGDTGISRADVVTVIGHPEAVHSALKQHSNKGRITHNANGLWVRVSTQRNTRPMRAVQPEFRSQDQNPLQ
jgi:hypothetical protein